MTLEHVHHTPIIKPMPATAALRRKLWICLALAGLLLAPFIGGLLKWDGLPPDFGHFPPAQGPAKAPFSPAIFALIAGAGAIFFLILLVPRLARFQPAPRPAAQPARAPLPFWFWIGALVIAVAWPVMWGQFSWAGPLVHWVFTPLWWGLILVLDGAVYRRTGGSSLLASRPRTLLGISLFSVVGWFFYEYLNFFALRNWFYPVNTVFSSPWYVFTYAVAYTTITTVILEWYQFLRTLGDLGRRFSRGVAIAPSRQTKKGLLALGFVTMAACALWPNPMFFTLWIGPILVLASALSLAGAWTPFTPIARGDWTAAILAMLGSLCTGLVWEFWNYWSFPANPHFWRYDIPYVNVSHLFEMPLLGYLGYLPFGIGVWVWWLAAAHLFGLSPAIGAGQDGDPEE
jgi:hypothetical protein